METKHILIAAGVLLLLGLFLPLVDLPGGRGSVSALGRMGAAAVVPVGFWLGACLAFAKYEERITMLLGGGLVLFWSWQVYLIHTKAAELIARSELVLGFGVGWGAGVLLLSGGLVVWSGWREAY